MWLSVIFRTISIYFIVLLAIRVMGKRELAQLSPFDFVISIIIAELAALPMEEKNIPLWEVIIPLGVLVILEIALSFITLKSERARGWIYGFPTVVIIDGVILDNNMRKLRYNINDLLAQLRDRGVFDVTDVQCAIMEVSGTLSVILNSSKGDVTTNDLGLRHDQDDLPIPVIFDGKIRESNLKDIEFNKEWLIGQLSKQHITADEIFLATYSSKKGLKIVSKKGQKLPRRFKHFEN